MICRWCGLVVLNLALFLGYFLYFWAQVPSKPLRPGRDYENKLTELRRNTADQVDWAIKKHSFLVIGGTGFTGGHLVDDLVARGAKLVRVVSRRKPADLKKGVDYVAGSITKLETMKDAVKGITIVFHTAASYGNPPFGMMGSGQKVFDVNEGGMKNIVKACQDEGVKLLIFTSSVDTVFTGRRAVNISEDTPYAQEEWSHYTHSKIAAEKHCLKSDKSNGLRTMALRPNGIIGPGENWFIPKTVAPAYIMGCAWFYLDLEQFTDWTSVYNLAWAHMLVVAQFEKNPDVIGGKPYFITDGEATNSAGFKVFQPVIEAIGAYFKPLVPFGSSMLPKIGYGMEVLAEYIPFSPFVTTHEAWKGITTHTHNIARAKADFGYEPLFNTTTGMVYIAEEFGRRFGVH